jgi:hypothetical protein
LGQCQLDHFELPCAADMSPMQVRNTASLDCQQKPAGLFPGSALADVPA